MSRIVILSRAGEASLPVAAVNALRVQHEVAFVQRTDAPCAAQAVELLRGARVLASTNVTLPALDPDLLDRLPHLRHVVLYATGFEHLDIDGLAARGITVTTLPEYATNAVAEHALALLFAGATRLHLAHDKAAGRAPHDVSLRGVEITSRTLAIIGLGRIGRRLATLARGLGMRVVGVDVDPAAIARAQADGIPTMTHRDALGEADLVADGVHHRRALSDPRGPRTRVARPQRLRRQCRATGARRHRRAAGGPAPAGIAGVCRG